MHYNLVADLTQKGLAGSGLQSLNAYGPLGASPTAATIRLERNEEAPSVYTDTVALDQLRHAVITGGKLSEQRLAFEMRPEMKNTLAYWWSRIVDEIIFKKLSGVTFTDQQSITFGEAAVANTNVLFGGSAASLGDLTDSDKFTLDLVRKAKTIAKTGIFGSTTVWRMRPMVVNGKPYYGCVLHPYQVYDLQGNQQWEQAMREAQVRGNENPLFTGALAMWNGVIFYEHDKVVTGTDAGAGANVRYASALFFGLQAGIWAEAQTAVDWIEKLFDFDDQYAVATGMMFGFDKTMFNSKDFSVIRISTAASNPAL